MRFAGEFAALGTACCWAVGANLFTAAGRRMGPRALNRLRLTVGAALLTAALWLTAGSPWPVWASAREVGLLSASGLIGFAIGDRWFFQSLVILGAGRAALLSSLAPLFTAAIGWPVLGERLGAAAWLGVAMTIGGIAWVILERRGREHAGIHGSVAVGVAAGLLGAIGQAVGYILSKLALSGGLDPLSATVIRICAAGAAVWMWTAARGEFRGTIAALQDRRAAAFMVGGSVLGPVLGVTLSLAALRFIEAGVAASIIAVAPVLTLAISARFHGEPFGARALLGATVAAAGVVVLFLR